MPLTTLQTRGALTVPQTDRATLDWTAGQLLVTTLLTPDRLCLRAIPDANTLFAQYTAALGPPVSETAPPTTGRWLPAAALWHAQADPASPWRPLWQTLSHGMQTRRCDPTILAAWADQMATIFPTQSRADQADYLQAVCAWPGVDLPDRAFWLTVCTVWGQSDRAWSEIVWQVRDAETPDARPEGDDAPADTTEDP